MRELTEEQYARRIDRLYELVFKQRMIDLLENWKRVLREEGYTVHGPYDLSDSEYNWYITVEGKGLPELVDVTIEMPESVDYEGNTSGAAFGIDIVAEGGRIIGGYTPHNFTEKLWVPVNAPRELSERLALVEQADIQGGVDLLDEYRLAA